jgi:hypothetical protein
MTSSKILKALVIALSLPLLYLADRSTDTELGLTLISEAHAIVGRPFTPLSVAGVARRTTVRAAAASAATPAPPVATPQAQTAAARPAGAPPVGTVVSTLPAGCQAEIRSGVEYQNCGGVLYRSGFQGNNLIYVVQ